MRKEPFNEEERLAIQQQEHVEAQERQRDLPIRYDTIMPREQEPLQREELDRLDSLNPMRAQLWKSEQMLQPPPQEHGVPEQAIIDLLQTLPTPITITPHEDAQQQQIYYTYQVGEQTEDHPFGIALGATPDFLDAMRFSLGAALKQSNDYQEGGMDTL